MIIYLFIIIIIIIIFNYSYSLHTQNKPYQENLINIKNNDFDSNKIKNYLNLNNSIDFNNLENIESSINSCCLVNKKYIKNNDSLYQGKFEYEYNILNNNECNTNLYRLDSNRQLFFDNINNWSNSNCKKNNNYLGSCRHMNKECIDFVDKKFCDYYDMTWSDKTCHDKLDFIWTDKIQHINNNILINNNKNNNSFINKLF